MKAITLALLVPLAASAAAAPAGACLNAPGTMHAGSLAVTPVPSPIPIGKPFALQIVPCNAAPERLTVDAVMPAHRHGMNYHPKVIKTKNGFRAEGLLFHMPGEWEFVFDLRFMDGRSERITHRIVVK